MPKERVTSAQTDVLCSFFEENPEVLRGYKKTPQCRNAVQHKWAQITPQLNSLGPSRSSKNWAKYLSDMKTKLKRKQVKWKQNSEGTGPIIGNVDDFSEIGLRMFQILQQEPTNDNMQEESHDSPRLSDTEFESEEPVHEDNLGSEVTANNFEAVELPFVEHDTKVYDSPATIRITDNAALTVCQGNDEFDTFGKNIAQQLRTLPLAVALESQEMLLTVLRKQRIRVLSQNFS